MFITDMRQQQPETDGSVVNLRHGSAPKRLLTLLATLTLASLIANSGLNVKAYTFFPEYQNYVHTYLNSPSLGNWTYMEKPVFPVFLNNSELEIGQNWSIVTPLKVNHTYHVYCYGEWIDNGSEPKTDYDIYVYNPAGELEGYHTESAGLPEHLGTNTSQPFFVPQYSGNYTFVIRNDPRESKNTQQATFMIVEDVEPNVWHQHYVEGKDSNNVPVLHTSWTYEFITDNQYVEVWVKVPNTLDMYEARLYLMADSNSPNATILNGVPLAWEPGVYGERHDVYGGYNLESKEYRGSAYASSEFFGQDMFLNLTSPHKGKSLYHLVLIGEVGSGTIEFLIKTDFVNARLIPSVVPARVHAQENANVTYVSNSTDLKNATLQYSTNDWINATGLEMELLDNRTCTTTIPGQAAGTTVNYRVEASDLLENILVANGSYPVKNDLSLNLTAVSENVSLGENVTVKGYATPSIGSLPITVQFESAGESKTVLCYTSEDGSFIASFQPGNISVWDAQAKFEGDHFFYENLSPHVTVEVKEPSIFAKYSLYIGGGLGATAIVGAVVYWRKRRQ